MKNGNNIIGVFCATLLLIMTFLGGVNAVLRYSSKYVGITLSSNAFLEAQWYLFSAIFLLGAGYTLKKDRHVRVDVLYGRLSKERKRVINIVGTIVFLVPFCCFGIWTSWEFVLNSWEIREMSPDAGGLPRYLVKVLIPIGFALLLVQALRSLFHAFYQEEPDNE